MVVVEADSVLRWLIPAWSFDHHSAGASSCAHPVHEIQSLSDLAALASFLPKSNFLHPFSPICLFFHLLPYFDVLIILLSFFLFFMNRMLCSDLSLTTVFIPRSSLCGRFHSPCSHQTSSYLAVPLVQVAGGQDIRVCTV